MTEETDQKSLSTAEWKVMKIVWELQKGMAREVYTIAGQEHGWSVGTVKTLLRRLVDKNYLSATPVGNGFVYRPAQAAITVLRQAATKLLENATREATAPLLAHMVESSQLAPEELESLQKILDEKKNALARQPEPGSPPAHKPTKSSRQ